MSGTAPDPKPSAIDVVGIAAQWCRQGRRVALATVVRTWGSSPLAEGSQLLVDGDGVFFGSVSGGCVEGAVIQEAREMLENGAPPRLLTFGVSNERAWEVGLSCGGEIGIFVERIE